MREKRQRRGQEEGRECDRGVEGRDRREGVHCKGRGKGGAGRKRWEEEREKTDGESVCERRKRERDSMMNR